MYNEYCQNRLKSEELQMSIGVTHPFFQECQRRLGHMLPLGAFLLKPVQRITKYQLMLKVCRSVDVELLMHLFSFFLRSLLYIFYLFKARRLSFQ